jgi:hypothetical protein
MRGISRKKIMIILRQCNLAFGQSVTLIYRHLPPLIRC